MFNIVEEKNGQLIVVPLDLVDFIKKLYGWVWDAQQTWKSFNISES